MMGRDKVDHVLRAAGALTHRNRFVLIGAAAIFAWREIVPPELSLTRDVDLFALDVPDDEADSIADELDGSLGQASQFDDTYGYYCDGVGPETAILPTDWRDRAKEYASPNTGGVTALVPHPDDIGLAKLCAGRPKDIDWLAAAARNALVDLDRIEARFGLLPKDRPQTDLATLGQRLQTVRARGR